MTAKEALSEFRKAAILLLGDISLPDMTHFIHGSHPEFETYIRHKLAVAEAGMIFLSLPIWEPSDGGLEFANRLFFHDFSKFTYKESGCLGYNFKDRSANTPEQTARYQWARHEHRRVNDHHPEYWLRPEFDGRITKFPMPLLAVREMICDWIAAQEYTKYPFKEWLPKNIDKICLHDDTRRLLDKELVHVKHLL